MQPIKKILEPLLREGAADSYQWFDPKDIVVSQWVRMKCRFGCDEYGRTATCPPNTPTVDECRAFFNEYNLAVVFHYQKTVEKPEDRYPWTRKVNLRLLEVERTVFLSGYRKAFLLFMDSCTLCADCSGQRTSCKEPFKARPAPEAMAVDVFATVRKMDFPIAVLSDYKQAMNRYAFLLIE